MLLFVLASPVGATSPYPNALPAATGPTLTVNALADQHSISPDIYGMNFYGVNLNDYLSLMQELHLPVDRWGGNTTTRYNWQTNSFNSGLDYFFEGNPNTANDPAFGQPSESDEMVSRNKARGTKSLITVPMIGYVSKSRTPQLCSFSVAKYGPQQAVDPYAPDCGNGRYPNGTPITGNDPLDSSVAVGPAFVQGWVNHLVTSYGSAANGGVKFYELDNEPSDWYETHRDVHPGLLTYDELRDRSYQYAAAIKQSDPGAKTLGPSNYGWYVYQDSQVPGDKAAHGNVGFSEWYLQQMRAYEQQHGVRILDYFDQHYYPAQPGVSLEPAGNAATQQLRLRSTRSLWDPTYVDESWISDAGFGPIQVLPRFRSWINANYPGTKLAITEYNFGGLESINGALTQADVLGIFGREQVDLATMWLNLPGYDLGTYAFGTQPGAYAFRIYRNYDGAGSTYGDTWVQSASSDQGQLAIYGAVRSKDQALTLVVINKTGNDLTSSLALSNFSPAASAQVYRYSAANLNAIVRQPDQPVTATGFSATYPANSISLIVIPKLTASFVVTIPDDNGATGTLSDALNRATLGAEITFALPNGQNTITVHNRLPNLRSGVIIRASCAAGKPSIIIDGSQVATVEDGLVVQGYSEIRGLQIANFKGKQLKVTGNGNRLYCTATTRKLLPGRSL
jgi:hypothetical protein